MKGWILRGQNLFLHSFQHETIDMWIASSTLEGCFECAVVNNRSSDSSSVVHTDRGYNTLV